MSYQYQQHYYPYPNYPQTPPSYPQAYPQQPPQQQRDPAQSNTIQELQDRLKAYEARLYGNNQAYQPAPAQEQPQQAPAQAQQPASDPQQPFMYIDSEQEARDFPIDPLLGLGRTYIFSLRNGLEIYAKRINPSNFDMEFRTWDLRQDQEHEAATHQCAVDNGILQSINSRLDKIDEIKQFADLASAFFLSGKGTAQEPEAPKQKKPAKKDTQDSEG